MLIARFFNEIFSDVGLFLSFLSLVATFVVSFMIYWLQRHHEKEVEKIENNLRKKELEAQANSFLVDHEDELYYLPWCAFASQLHRHEKHTRKIYTDFCRASNELQAEILSTEGYTFELLPKCKWLHRCFELLENDISSNKLGKDVLYDGAKYFHRGFERYRENIWNDVDSMSIYNPIYKGPWYKTRPSINCGEYISQYILYAKNPRCSEDILIFNTNPTPPIDYIWINNDLSNAPEDIVCSWVMTLVYDISLSISQENDHCDISTNNFIIDYTDAIIETYEDKYYSALQALYNTYILAIRKSLIK